MAQREMLLRAFLKVVENTIDNSHINADDHLDFISKLCVYQRRIIDMNPEEEAALLNVSDRKT